MQTSMHASRIVMQCTCIYSFGPWFVTFVPFHCSQISDTKRISHFFHVGMFSLVSLYHACPWADIFPPHGAQVAGPGDKGIGVCVGPYFSDNPLFVDWLIYWSRFDGVVGIHVYVPLYNKGEIPDQRPGMPYTRPTMYMHEILLWKTFRMIPRTYYHGQRLVYNDCIYRCASPSQLVDLFASNGVGCSTEASLMHDAVHCIFLWWTEWSLTMKSLKCSCHSGHTPGSCTL